MRQKFCLADLLGSQYFFEISHIPLIIKNNENVIKSGYFERPLPWTAPFFSGFFETKVRNTRYLVKKYAYFSNLLGVQ